MNLTPEQRKQAKGQGFLSNKDQVHFSARVITENGVLDAGQVRVLAEAAEKFGNGSVSFTTRLTVEVPGIRYEDIAAFQEDIARAGLVTGGTGPRVRPVVACKGTVCVFGCIDTQGLATVIHKRFYEGYRSVTLPHKFKIAVGGCGNNCVKPDLNDVGIIGRRTPGGGAACTVTVGGRWGRQIRIGTPLGRQFSEAEALDMIEQVILLYKELGQPGERLAAMVERLGVDEAERLLLSGDLLARKAEILGESAGGAK